MDVTVHYISLTARTIGFCFESSINKLLPKKNLITYIYFFLLITFIGLGGLARHICPIAQ